MAAPRCCTLLYINYPTRPDFILLLIPAELAFAVLSAPRRLGAGTCSRPVCLAPLVGAVGVILEVGIIGDSCLARCQMVERR